MPGPLSAAPPPTASEQFWRSAFFVWSALMGAWALVDFDAGRFAQGLGDAGVACLLLSVEARFPLMRALVRSDRKKQTTQELLRQAQRQRAEHPWPHRVGTIGWALLAASLILRWSGVA